MQNHNEYLKQIEFYLSDLSVIERAKILSEINSEISDKEVIELDPPLKYANVKRNEHGFVNFIEKRKFSLLGLFLKLTAILTICGMLFFGFLIWKFTPIFKVDEENNRVTILGGLIDIDGKAGKVKILDEYHFNQENFKNDLQASIALDQDKDEILINFESGSFSLTNSEDNEFKLDCKLSMQANKDVIQQIDDYIKIDLTKISGSSCELGVPEDKKITLEGTEANIRLLNPEFNTYIDLDAGTVAITPEQEIDYMFNLEVTNGFIGEFDSSEEEGAYEIQINIDTGSIITK